MSVSQRYSFRTHPDKQVNVIKQLYLPNVHSCDQDEFPIGSYRHEPNHPDQVSFGRAEESDRGDW